MWSAVASVEYVERCGETLQRTTTPDTATTTHEEPSCSRCTATCTATLDRRLVASDLPCRSQTQRAACRCLSLPVRLLQRMTTPKRCGALRRDAATNDHSGECDDRDGFLLKHARGAILRPLHWPPAPPRWTAAWWRQTCRAGPRHSVPPAAACRRKSRLQTNDYFDTLWSTLQAATRTTPLDLETAGMACSLPWNGAGLPDTANE